METADLLTGCKLYLACTTWHKTASKWRSAICLHFSFDRVIPGDKGISSCIYHCHKVCFNSPLFVDSDMLCLGHHNTLCMMRNVRPSWGICDCVPYTEDTGWQAYGLHIRCECAGWCCTHWLCHSSAGVNTLLHCICLSTTQTRVPRSCVLHTFVSQSNTPMPDYK